MPTVVLIVFASLVYSAFAVLIGRSGKGLNAYLNTAIFNTIGGLVPLAMYLWARYAKHVAMPPATTAGLTYATLAGVAIAAFNVLLLFVYSRGGVAYAMPTIYGTTIVLTSVVGWLFLGESVTLLGGVGVAVIAIGVALVIASKL